MTHADTLRSEFERYRDQRFLFVIGGGNWGDELIWLGAQHLADQVGIERTSVDFDTYMAGDGTPGPDQVIYIHGGGGFNPWSSGRVIRAFERAVTRHAGVVIQGPQTWENDADYVSGILDPLGAGRMAERVVMFAREPLSHGLLGDRAPDWLEVGLDLDTALHLTRGMLVERAGPVTPRYDLLVVREDDEGPGNVSPGDYDAVRLDPAFYASSFDHWLRIHAAARRIVTNRMHSSIAGAILELPTTLMAGSYHKNRSMWEFALAGRGVQWADYGDVLPLEPRHWPDLLSLLPGFIRNSWKVKRLAKRLQGVPGA